MNWLEMGRQLTQMRPQSASLQGLRQRNECMPQQSWSLLPPYLGLQPYIVVHQSLCFRKTTRCSARGVNAIRDRSRASVRLQPVS